MVQVTSLLQHSDDFPLHLRNEIETPNRGLRGPCPALPLTHYTPAIMTFLFGP